MVVKVAVLGAGINGLACAVKIKEKYRDSKVVLIASEFTPNTTGDGAGGLWCPYLCGTNAKHRFTKWGFETYNLLHQLWLEGGHDVCLIPFFTLYRDRENWKEPDWSNIVFGYRTLDEKYLKYLNGLYSADYTAGHTFLSFIYTPTSFLKHLMKRFENLNGETSQATISSLEDPLLEQFDVVVNCLGLSAKTVVPDDRVFAIRGQVSKVIAPWVKEAVLDVDSGHYVLPNVHLCIVGGTHQEHDYNKNVDENDTDFIFNGCQSLIPSLRHVKILSHWVGLRPGRDEIRLEEEGRNRKLYIHNYGHGGSGLTLFWGCATEVLQLLDKHLNKNNLCKL